MLKPSPILADIHFMYSGTVVGEPWARAAIQ
jgi:hypothetical protein